MDETPMWVTVARRVVIAHGRTESEAVPWNQPIMPEVRWLGEQKASDADIIKKIPDATAKSISMESSPGLDRVIAFMSEQPLTNGEHVGFVAVKRAIVSFVMNCAEEFEFEGLDPAFVSWADAEIGTVDCSREPDPDDPVASGYVKDAFC
ncbi:hypothetical protein AB0M02_24875 [Actinoplanes sp. NPDC051861]|uniref:hypothetical protein n=1 Tax=Actinoplanes sp. NPDC051861 TaxID=3155170 RepID=UPI0034347A88